jgi:hypothetical protein
VKIIIAITMKIHKLVWATLSFSSILVAACGGDHGRPVREWSQEELDELEAKWGTDVSPHLISRLVSPGSSGHIICQASLMGYYIHISVGLNHGRSYSSMLPLLSEQATKL